MSDSMNAAAHTRPTIGMLWTATGRDQDDVIQALRESRSASRVRAITDDLSHAWKQARWLPPDTKVYLPAGFWALVGAHARYLDQSLFLAVSASFGGGEAFLARSLGSLPRATRVHAVHFSVDMLRRYDEIYRYDPGGILALSYLQLEREAKSAILTFAGGAGQELFRQWSEERAEVRDRRRYLAVVLSAMSDTPAAILDEIRREIEHLSPTESLDRQSRSAVSGAVHNLLRHPNSTLALRTSLLSQSLGDVEAQEILFRQADVRRCPEVQGLCLTHLRRERPESCGLSVATLVRLLPDASDELRAACWTHLMSSDGGRKLVLLLLGSDRPGNPLTELLRSHPETVLASSDAEVRRAGVIALSRPLAKEAEEMTPAAARRQASPKPRVVR